MATIVLSYAGAALGTAVGGPLGGAVGRALGGIAGNIIDQRLLGGGTRREGPRLQDLRIMASEEGAAIPALWGRMRIAGQVIWATNLLEVQSTTTEDAGGKGSSSRANEVTTYSYSANFAVGLCEGEIDGLGRVWADGREIDISGFTHRLHRGTETQTADSLIAAVEGTGNAPAYRGLAYVVFERLPLTDFGNRIPQLSFEVMRPGNDTADRIKGVCLIPGSTEFGYDTTRVARAPSEGVTESENAHASGVRSDWSVSLDQLEGSCRNVEAAALVVAWFGTDLRCGSCEVKPGVESRTKATTGAEWRVGGLARAAAHEVSKIAGSPAYGGTPSDASVLQAIADLKARGLAVVFYPFILMDVAAGNALPDPYGGAAQGAYPWRGRITANTAPGLQGTPDKTASAVAELASFTGSAAPQDFVVSGGEVLYTGPAEWSYRRMILHYAKLCALAGGVDAFLIGSEMRGLTTLRSGPSTYPFVSALVALAAEVKAILPGAKVSYAADWSEYFGHQPADGSNDVHFHLDPLWASAAIDFIGIDNYMPLADWRDGGAHLDAQGGAASIYSLDYLRSNVAGGEGHDFFYASPAAREAQSRTAITDGAYNKPWVFRYKDLKEWWSNPHVNRPGGIESLSPTVWVPQSKPFWFTEAGCPAIDKGANQPNVFFDAKSSESAVPWFSSGRRDDLMQQRYLRALHDHWSAVGAHNPQSTEYSGRMVEASRIFVWAWDARPFPFFPALTAAWSDGPNYARGHWLNGRIGAVDLGDLIAAVCARHGLPETDVSTVAGLVDGFLIDRPMSGREALESLLNAFSIDAVESGGKLVFRPRDILTAVAVDDSDLAELRADEALMSETRAQETDLPRAVRLGYADASLDYRTGAVWQRRPGGAGEREINLSLPAAVTQSLAQARADVLLAEAMAARTSSRFALPPKYLRLEPGDILSLSGRDWRVTGVADGAERRLEAVAHDAALYEAWGADDRDPIVKPTPHYGRPDALFMDLATTAGSEETAPWIAARATPWPRALALLKQTGAASFSFERLIYAQATMGSTLGPLPAGATDRIDWRTALDVRLGYGALQSVSKAQLLNGANRAAIGSEAAGFEIVQFQTATLIATNTYRIEGLIRACDGSQDEMPAVWPAGSRFILLNAAVVQPAMSLTEASEDSLWRLGPAQLDHGDPAYAEKALGQVLKALRPLSPVRLKSTSDASGVTLSWIRRTRTGGDSWALTDVPLGEASEAYRVTILDGAAEKRIAEVGAPSFFYSTANMAADFGGVPTAFTARVQQLSAATGAGSAIERIINV